MSAEARNEPNRFFFYMNGKKSFLVILKGGFGIVCLTRTSLFHAKNDNVASFRNDEYKCPFCNQCFEEGDLVITYF